MARRTLTTKKFTARPWQSSKDPSSRVPLGNLAGMDFLSDFAAWAEGQSSQTLSDKQKKRYVAAPTVVRLGDYAVLVKSSTGPWGDPGRQVKDVDSDNAVYTTQEMDASTIPLRCMLVVPPGGLEALLYVEREGHSQVGVAIADRYVQHLKLQWQLARRSNSNARTFTIDFDSVLSSDEWFELARLDKVTATAVRRADADSLSPTAEQDVELSMTVQPAKKKTAFGREVRTQLFEDPRKGLVSINIPVESFGDAEPEVTLTMTGAGRTKTFALRNPRTPYSSLVLHEDGDRTLTDAEFVQRCVDEASDYFEDRNLTWREGWVDLAALD